MIHKHFGDIASTQDYLLENQAQLGENPLISCENQFAGHGQYDRVWDSYQGSLCMSFGLRPNEVITLTSLELGCLAIKYYLQVYGVKLALKWPNDVLTTSGHKVGGILINNSSGQKQLIAGIGLNYLPLPKVEAYKTPAGSILSANIELDKKTEALSFYTFILNNRMSADEVVKTWNENCIHMNKEVTLTDSGKSFKGEFVGIGRNGEAIIHHEGTTASYYSGSIFL